MPEFERSANVSAAPDAAFEWLSTPANLPRYVATMVTAQPEQGGRMHVAADVEGRHEEGEASFRADGARRTIEWGAQDGSGYSGRLQVSPAASGCQVTIRLNIQHTGDETEINRVLDQTVSNIQEMLPA